MTIEQIVQAMHADKAVRRAIAKRSHKFFFHFYLGDYVDYPIAPFHDELFELTQDLFKIPKTDERDELSMLVVSAFRNSGKSTVLTLSYVMWAIISGRAKYILIISENQLKAQTFVANIRQKLEVDGPLKRDLGPFQEDRAGWNSVSLTIKNYGAKITAVSTDQSVRGLRYGSHRPDLIIIDDAESDASVKTQESRDKLSKWLGADVIPAGHSHTKLIVIGSMLHPDSLIPRLQKRIDNAKIAGLYRMYPILDEAGNPTWPGKYPDLAAVEREKARGIPEREWKVEYELRPPTEENQIIRQEHIRYYNRPPEPGNDTYTGVDLAIAQTSTADYTAMVSGVVVEEEDGWHLDILPNPINERLQGPQILERIVDHSLLLGDGRPTPMYIEKVAFQQAMIDFVEQRGIPVEGVSPGGNDKRARLISISALIKSGKVRFPQKGAEKLLMQVLYFGAERHDDLVDALIILVLKVFENLERNRLVVPSPYYPPEGPRTQEEGEAWADKGARLRQEAERSSDPLKWHEYQEWEAQDQQQRPEYEEERRRLNNEMRRRRGF